MSERNSERHRDRDGAAEAGAAQPRAVARLARRDVLGGLTALAAFSVAAHVEAQQATVQPSPSQKAPALAPARRIAPLMAAPPQPIEVFARSLTGFGRSGVPGGKLPRLEFIGGLVLTSPAKEFGGWSGLVTSDDGRRLFAVSDQGSWMSAELVSEGGRPKGLADVMLGEIPGTGGQVLSRGRDRDAESVVLLDGTLARGTVLIAFERNHRIGRYPITERGLGPPAGFLKMPPDARKMGFNKGLESVAVLRGGPLKGAVVAFAEELYDTARNHTGWIWPGGIASEPQKLNLTNAGDFAITDAASLPDGSLIVLERRFRWLEGVKMRIRFVRAADVKPGALLDGELLLDTDMSSEIDNMEALGLSRNARGQTVLTLMSDNNFNSMLQRNLLLQFVLTDPVAQKAARP